MDNGPEIATARLRIGRMTVGDAEAFHGYRSNPAVHAHLSFVPSDLADSREFLRGFESVQFDTPDTWFQLGVYLADTGILIGDMGVHFLDSGSQSVEIGYAVAPQYQGLGYGQEAVGGLLQFSFETLGKRKVQASVDPSNEASIALLKRLGMTQESHHPSSLCFKGAWVDDMIFALLRKDWIKA